jgi:hypothetical protein
VTRRTKRTETLTLRRTLATTVRDEDEGDVVLLTGAGQLLTDHPRVAETPAVAPHLAYAITANA